MSTLSEKEIRNIKALIKNSNPDSVAKLVPFVLGFRSSLSGTKYLELCIRLRYESEDSSLCRELYPEIAERCNTTPSRVERSIRHAISDCFDSGCMVRINELAGCQIINNNYPPSNKEFVSAVCKWIRLERELF